MTSLLDCSAPLLAPDSPPTTARLANAHLPPLPRRISTPFRTSIFSSPAPLHRRPRRIFCQKQQDTLAPSAAGVVTDRTWKELVLDSDIPVLVDFWAPWCGPCRMIAPLVDELAVQYAGRCRCLKLNTDEFKGIATEYGIRSIPTMMIFKNGEKKDTIIGAVPKAALITAIERFLDR